MNDTDHRFDQQLDVTGLLCPMPVLRARRVLDDMRAGELLLVIASDPASVHDMPAFCKMSGHKLHMARVEDGQYLFEIEKALTGQKTKLKLPRSGAHLNNGGNFRGLFFA